jgi:predicted RNA-binding Zn-ribbon protein involved in translation (DUF1610 family)
MTNNKTNTCIDCGKPITKYAQRCLKCMYQHRTILSHICPDCGKKKSGESIRCKSCDTKLRWAEGKMDVLKSSCRERNPSWGGGRNKNKAGYILILKPDHPRAHKTGYVLEHIVVWEQAHGKRLPKGWIIHHLNGIPDDNRPVNLQALPNKKHYLLLQAKAKRIQELEGMLNNQHQLL